MNIRGLYTWDREMSRRAENLYTSYKKGDCINLQSVEVIKYEYADNRF